MILYFILKINQNCPSGLFNYGIHSEQAGPHHVQRANVFQTSDKA
jgi:hypothetical protein